MQEIKNNPKLSPMMRRYFEIKENYKDAIVLFRLGDFYEMFFDDAVTASKVLDLTLTGRDCGLSERAPMCGVPYHAVDGYVRKLIEQGYRVAICEQLTDPATSKGMVERDVIRVITKGTIMEDTILDEKAPNYLASISINNDNFGLSWSDISTGEFCVFQGKLSELDSMLCSISPSETVCGFSEYNLLSKLNYFSQDNMLRAIVDSAYNYDNAEKSLLEQFQVVSLSVYGCENEKLAVSAAGGLLEYLKETQKRTLSQLRPVKLVKKNSFMMLDGNTKRNLELVARAKDGKRNGSLLGVLDCCETSMGSRSLKRLIEQPLQNKQEICERLNATEYLFNNISIRERLKEYLSGISDLERLTAKIPYGTLTPKDCVAIRNSLKIIPDIKLLLIESDSEYIKELADSLNELENLKTLLFNAIDENNVQSKDGGYILDSYDENLKKYRHIKENAKVWLANLEAEERVQSGIKTLHIGYNRVFGYYIEVSKSFIDKVPYRYQRKQTLTTGERYVTPELKEIEEQILNADENASKLEASLFAEIKEVLLGQVSSLQQNALALACIDVCCSLATVAVKNRYCKPSIVDGNKIIISEGRHPVVEKLSASFDYIPNDTCLNGSDSRTMIITGPNMAGKSTYMRQVALITLMAHIGSFVPAKKAEISIVDRIFTRIGASDDLSSGQSTFMVEMIEVATILNNATENSLLLLDEIGRGTSTIDGLSIAWAVMEEINKNVKANTLFATHFHELIALDGMEGVKLFKVLVKEINGSVLFLHKISEGGANKSFGIEVAQIAGVPKSVVDNAKRIMKSIESGEKVAICDGKKAAADRVADLTEIKLAKFDTMKEILEGVEVNNCTPIEALSILDELIKRSKD